MGKPARRPASRSHRRGRRILTCVKVKSSALAFALMRRLSALLAQAAPTVIAGSFASTKGTFTKCPLMGQGTDQLAGTVPENLHADAYQEECSELDYHFHAGRSQH